MSDNRHVMIDVVRHSVRLFVAICLLPAVAFRQTDGTVSIVPFTNLSGL